MNLINIKENIGYIENSCNIGYIIEGSDVILIDSGLEDAVAKKISKLLINQHYKIRAIINTHSHADHCGGNYYMQTKLDVKVYASELESAIIENPYIEPLYLSAGAAPLKELTGKFLMAKPSTVDHIITKDKSQVHIGPVNLDIIPLLGHSMNQIGIGIEGVLYCGDSILNNALLEKHKIPFNVNISEQIQTLEYLRESDYEIYIPSHCPPMNKEELYKAIDENLKVLNDINNTILRSLDVNKTLEEIENYIFQHYNITINSMAQYALLRTAVIAHINYLFDNKNIDKIIEDNKIIWKIIDM